MSEDESFLERWARRKRAAANNVRSADAPSAADAPRPTGGTPDADPPAANILDPAAAGERGALPDVDLGKLPSLDSITAETDIRAFLGPGVPAELSRAALRRAWSADPAIRDFVGLADYDWDFTTDGAIPGFGPLEMTDDLRRRVSEMVGRNLPPDVSSPSRPAGEDGQTPEAARSNSEHGEVLPGPAPDAKRSDVEMTDRDSTLDQSSSRICEEIAAAIPESIAAQQSPATLVKEPERLPRRHGRALPT